MIRTYGRLVFDAGHWLLEAEPHVMIRARRLFPRGPKAGPIRLRATDEVARDLAWLTDRWPLDVSDEDRLRRAAETHDRRVAECHDLLTGTMAPRGFQMALPPREYQRVAADMLLRVGGLLLADDVGLGKTATAICVLTEPATRPALVVTLTHLPPQWVREIGRFAPDLKVHVATSGRPYDIAKAMMPRRARKAADAGQISLIDPDFPDVLILNYHKLQGWADVLTGKMRTVVFDEVQELRRRDSYKWDAAKAIAERAAYRIGLSATPIYNYGGEFWSVLQALRPDALGTQDEFITEWCTTYGAGDKARIKDPVAFGAYLRDQGLMLRRTRLDVGRELPALTKAVHVVDTDAKALDDVAAAASALAKVILARDSAWEERGQAARELDWRLRQATGVAKAIHVADFVRLLVESGEKVVLYGWHRDVYALWMERLKDLDPVMYTGSESIPQKEAARAAFVEGRSQVLVMSLRAGAGLDGLQGSCRTVVFGELDWSPGVHEQATGRVHRDGQAEPVVAYYLMAESGSDPIVAQVLGVKRQQIEGVRDPDAAIVQTAEAREDATKMLARAALLTIQRDPDRGSLMPVPELPDGREVRA